MKTSLTTFIIITILLVTTGPSALAHVHYAHEYGLAEWTLQELDHHLYLQQQQQQQITFVMCYAPWMAISPILFEHFEALHRTFAHPLTLEQIHVNTTSVDCGTHFDLRTRYDIKDFPAFLLFRGSEMVKLWETPRYMGDYKINDHELDRWVNMQTTEADIDPERLKYLVWFNYERLIDFVLSGSGSGLEQSSDLKHVVTHEHVPTMFVRMDNPHITLRQNPYRPLFILIAAMSFSFMLLRVVRMLIQDAQRKDVIDVLNSMRATVMKGFIVSSDHSVAAYLGDKSQ